MAGGVDEGSSLDIRSEPPRPRSTRSSLQKSPPGAARFLLASAVDTVVATAVAQTSARIPNFSHPASMLTWAVTTLVSWTVPAYPLTALRFEREDHTRR